MTLKVILKINYAKIKFAMKPHKFDYYKSYILIILKQIFLL